MHRAAFVFASVALCACTASTKHMPPTEVLVHIDASNEVRAAARQLRIRPAVQPNSEASWIDRDEVTINVGTAKSRPGQWWPFDVPVIADPNHTPQLLQLVVEAIDGDGEVLVGQRALTSFVKQSQLVLQLELVRCGELPLGTACEADAQCHGHVCQTCTAGACANTPITMGEALSTWKPNGVSQPLAAGTMAGAAGSSAGKPAGSGGDGGSDAGVSGQGGRGASAGSDAAGKGGTGGGPALAGMSSEPATSTSSHGASKTWGKWSQPATLDMGANDIQSPGIARNHAGDVVVGWWQDGDAGEYIWMRRFVGGSWEPRPFYVQGGTAVTTFADRTRPGLGIDASGTAGLFYLGKVDSVSDNRFQAFWAQWNGVAKPAWDTTVVSDQLYAAPTILSVSEAGTAYATWAGLPDSKMLRPLYLNQYEAGSWGTPMQFGTVPDDGGPWYYYKTGNDAGDTALLVRREAQIRPFLLHGTDVVTPGALTLPAPSPLNALSLHLDDARNIVVVVLAGAEALKLQPYRIRCPVGAATCSSPEAIGSTTASSIALAGNPSGVLQVLTLDSSADTNQGHIVARTYSESAGWSEGERISDDFTLLTEGSSISTSANSWGDIVVAWQQSTTLADGSSGKALAFNHYSPKDGWAKAGIVTTYPGVLGLVGVTLHDDGHALLVWDHQPVMDQASHLKWSRN